MHFRCLFCVQVRQKKGGYPKPDIVSEEHNNTADTLQPKSNYTSVELEAPLKLWTNTILRAHFMQH